MKNKLNELKDFDEFQELNEMPRLKRSRKKDKTIVSKYWSSKGKYQKDYNKFWDELIPGQGNAETVQGELLRNISRLAYDRYNNGFGNPMPHEANQLKKYKDRFTKFLKDKDAFKNFYNAYRSMGFGEEVADWHSGAETDQYFDDIINAIVLYIKDSDGVYEILPKEDRFFD